MSGYYERLLEGRKKRKTIYLSPEDFVRAAADYFEWCETHPILEEQVNIWQGNVIRTQIPKVRPFTKKALCNYLGIPDSRLGTYRSKGGDWEEVVDMIEQVIYTQKFEHATAGLMNSNIISRDLGLAEKQELTGKDGEPLQQVVQYQLPDNGRDK